MNSLLDIAWLIPAFPLFGAILVGLLLVSFNRTMNRLTKPVTFLVIICILLSSSLSIAFCFNHLSGEIFNSRIHIASIDFLTSFYLYNKSAIFLSCINATFLLICLFSYYKLNRSKGYVRYMSLLSLLCGSLLFYVLDNQIHSTTINALLS